MKYTLRAYRAEPATQEEADNGPLIFTASTEGIKRDGLDLSMNQWDLTNYRKNPVVLWAHDYFGRTLPIGRATVEYDEKSRSLKASIEFDPADDFAVAIQRKFRAGYLNAVSVGWNTIIPEGKPIREVKQTDITLDLLDISAVPVPGDPDALMERSLSFMREIEPRWNGVAKAMVDLYLGRVDMEEVDRRAYHQTLARQYQLLGKVAPEYLSRSLVDRLTNEQILGLFAEGEAELVLGDDTIGQGARAGAALNKRNKSDLEQIVSLAQAILTRSQTNDKEEEAEDDETQLRAFATIHNIFKETTV